MRSTLELWSSLQLRLPHSSAGHWSRKQRVRELHGALPFEDQALSQIIVLDM
jgi:hypothetical protein